MNLLLNYLITNGIPKNLSSSLTKYFSKKNYDKKSIILRMGEHTNDIYFIIKGLVRGYYISEKGEEITKCFAKEGEWCCVHNLLSDAESEFYIETLEDCTFLRTDINILRKILNTNLELQKIYSRLVYDAIRLQDKRNLYFQGLTGKERYLLFLKENPELAERVNQEYIASYIGITKTSLSRLKRDL